MADFLDLDPLMLYFKQDMDPWIKVLSYPCHSIPINQLEPQPFPLTQMKPYPTSKWERIMVDNNVVQATNLKPYPTHKIW